MSYSHNWSRIVTEIYNFVLILVFPGPSRRGNHNSWKQLKCRRNTRQRPQKPMLTTIVTVFIALLWKIFMDWLFGSEYAGFWLQPETKKIVWLLSSTIRKQVFSSTTTPYHLSTLSPPQTHRSLSNVLRASLHRTNSMYYPMQCEQFVISCSSWASKGSCAQQINLKQRYGRGAWNKHKCLHNVPSRIAEDHDCIVWE